MSFKKRSLTRWLVVGHVLVSPHVGVSRRVTRCQLSFPISGYTGFDYTSANYIDPTAAPYAYYVRRSASSFSLLQIFPKLTHILRSCLLKYRHNPFILYDSIALNATRRNRTRNFNNFAQDLQADALPQYIFITPNVRTFDKCC